MVADPGRLIGKYQLIAEIARGGMGIVYLALVKGPGGFNKLVVVKELKPDLVEEPAFLTMFLDEARLAARLSHPNIVQTNEVANEGNRYYMAMDYLDGRGLDRVRRRTRAVGSGMSLAMHLRVISNVLAGLEYAHTLCDFDGTPLSIVHRDISPQNVFITFDGQVKVLDFGIAKAATSLHETHAGVLKGKVSYMAPEQARGHKVDARADVFSTGVLLWEALTGQRINHGKNEQEVIWALVSGELPRASVVKPGVPPELDDICARAMAWNRDERYPSAAAMRDAIEGYLAAAGMSITNREIGSCIAELFSDDRAATSALIEASVARSRDVETRESLPVFDLATSPFGHAATPSLSNPSGSIPSLPLRSMTTGIPPPPKAGAAPSQPMATVLGPRSRGLRTILLTFLLVTAALASMLIFVRVWGGHDAAPAIAKVDPAVPAAPMIVPRPAASPTPASAPATPRPKLVEVEIRVSPSTASMTIDGAEVTGNPFHGRYSADAAMHQVRATAPGYVARARAVAFDADVTLDLTLDRVPSTRAAAAPRAAHSVAREPSEPAPSKPATEPAAAPKPAATDVNPAGGTKPRRPIDPNNPYGAE